MITATQKYKLKKFVKEMELYRGRHTELVSVYIPEGYDLNKVMNHLSQEAGTATNIKSTSTRKNVCDALEKMIQHLRIFKQTPQNGLAAFAGNVAENEGQTDFKVVSIEPPVPLKIRIYRCDKQFVLEPLAELVEDKETYGLVVMDRREGDIAFLRGKSITKGSRARSNVPGKTRAGGQSSQRFERLRDGAAKDFYKKLADMMKAEFLGKESLKGIIVGGPGPTKYDFVDGNFITNEVKKKIVAIKDLSYTGPFGLQELVDKSQDVLAEEDIANEKKSMIKFFELLATKPGMVSYGEKEVMNNVKNGVVDLVLISEAADEKLIEQFEQEAVRFGTVVQIISIETREGVQLRDIGKVACILRYDTGG